MPNIPAINLPNVNPAAGLPTILTQIAQGIGQAPQALQQQQVEQEQAKYDKEYLKTQQQQMDIQVQQQQQQQAQTRLNFLSNIFKTDNTKANDPQYVQAYTDVMGQLGLPPNLTPTGGVNMSQFQKPLSEADPNTIIKFAEMPKEQRAAALAAAGFTADPKFLAADQYTTSKDQAALQRAQTAGIHESDWNAIQTKRLAYQKEIDDARAAQDYARVASLEMQAKLAPQRLAIEQQNANTRLFAANKAAQTADARINQFNTNASLASQRLVQQSAKAMLDEGKALDTQIDTMRGKLDAALSGGADPDDANIKSTSQRIDDLTKARAALDKKIEQANEIVTNGMGAAGTLKQASGANSVTPADNKWTPPANAVSGKLKDGRKAWQTPDGALYDANGNRLN